MAMRKSKSEKPVKSSRTTRTQPVDGTTPEVATSVPQVARNGADQVTNGVHYHHVASPEIDRIRERAYELYLKRGGAHGHDLADWLSAERELSGQHSAAS